MFGVRIFRERKTPKSEQRKSKYGNKGSKFVTSRFREGKLSHTHLQKNLTERAYGDSKSFGYREKRDNERNG